MGSLRTLKQTTKTGTNPKGTAPVLPQNLQDPTAFTVDFNCCGKSRKYSSNHSINKTHYLECEICGKRYEYQSHFGYPPGNPGGVWIFYFKGVSQYLFPKEEAPPKKSLLQKLLEWWR
jgi:hypothetical protein